MSHLKPDITCDSHIFYCTGPTGPRGPTGCTGPKGITGPKGLQGLIGATGHIGTTGPIGPTGPQGIPGTAAFRGATGPTGPIGLQGVQGPTGQDGSAVAKGDTGPRGQTGPTGARGSTGPQGIPGTAVAKGATGPTGIQGVRGITGPTGLPGEFAGRGATGQTGPKGAPGAVGPRGATGASVSVNSVMFYSNVIQPITLRNTLQPVFFEQVSVPTIFSTWTAMELIGATGPTIFVSSVSGVYQATYKIDYYTGSSSVDTASNTGVMMTSNGLLIPGSGTLTYHNNKFHHHPITASFIFNYTAYQQLTLKIITDGVIGAIGGQIGKASPNSWPIFKESSATVIFTQLA
jgi:hypothetical protein